MDQYDIIVNQLGQIKTEQQHIRDKTIETHTKVQELCRQNKRLFETIEGNGKPGIKQELAEVRQIQSDCVSRRKEAVGKSSNAIAIVALVFAIITPLFLVPIGKKLTDAIFYKTNDYKAEEVKATE